MVEWNPHPKLAEYLEKVDSWSLVTSPLIHTNVCQVSLASSFCTCTFRVMALEQSTALGDKCKLKPVTACGSGFGLVFTTSVLGIELQDVWFGSAA